MMPEPALSIENLRTYFYSKSKKVFIRSVDGVDLNVLRGETLGIVGESGSGKSVTALSVMGLVRTDPGVITGSVWFQRNGDRENLLKSIDQYVHTQERDGQIMEVRKDNRGWSRNVDRLMDHVRGREISMIFQNPRVSLNPFMTIGRQITESILLNTGIQSKGEAVDKAKHWLERVKIDSPELRFNNYPYGLSGGMCQRAMIAMALSSEPSLLIADEPTTGLDSTIQSKIVELLSELKEEVGVTTVLISHDISMVARLADNIAVMYGGRVLERGPSGTVLSPEVLPKHPYTMALLKSIPSDRNIQEKDYLKVIDGDVFDTVNIPEGCRFFERCDQVHDGIKDRCMHREPGLDEVADDHQVRCWLYVD
jgi:oligopeptide/dipeptide ABC transporter ATP-binding protein